MLKYPLARKISFLLITKVLLLIALWKFCFSHPLSETERQAGLSARYSTSEKMNGQ